MFYVEINHKRAGSPNDAPTSGQRQRSGPFSTREEAERFARAQAGTTPIWSAQIIEEESDTEDGAA